ncbi:hypothetical protein BSKO_00810 [Bryopsis sp. KO-2023]|nr:hypothetical protein BSKO_00810 [Bryopsis sp. KO-2023]
MAPQNLLQSLFEREVGGGVGVREGRPPVSVAERERGLYEWATHDSLRHCASECCSLSDAYPRSTIAVAISRDGNLSASTHGDHTVKIIDFNTGKFVRALEGHHRTPWTVRFHPINCSMVVSGSLDFEVRVWDVDTGECLQSKNFGSPISSLCFHPTGDFLAVAGGDKLHLWEYDHANGCFGKASVVLKTTETIRTVHFHPLGAPMIMTTERVEPKSIQENPEAAAVSRNGGRRFENGANSGHHQSWYAGDQATPSGNVFGVQPPPVIFPYPYNGPVFNRASQEILSLGSQPNQGNGRPPAAESLNFWGAGWMGQNQGRMQGRGGYIPPQGMMGQFPNGHHGMQPLQPIQPLQPGLQPMQQAPIMMPVQPAGAIWPGYGGEDRRTQNDMMSSAEIMTLAGQFRGLRFGPPPSNPAGRRYSSDMDRQGWWPGSRPTQNRHQSVDEAAMRRDEWPQVTLSLNPERVPRADILQSHPRTWPNRRGNHHRRRGSRGSYGGMPYPPPDQDFVIPEIPLIPPGRGGAHADPPAALELVPTEGASEVPLITHTALTRIGQIFASLPGFNSQELPCTTRLTMWKFDRDNPHKNLKGLLLEIPGTVLCSEMGAHMSSCGRFLAVCTASLGPTPKMGYSYELKVISLERDTFGEVVRSRPISAGHCLTSVQFSPGSDMILLSYGRKHRFLVRELVSQGQTIGEIHTLLEVYRASDLALVRVLHSVEDEANTACFHPFAGEGILYGTKGGKLRILRHTQTHMTNGGRGGDVYRFEDELLKVDELADSTALGIEAGGG